MKLTNNLSAVFTLLVLLNSGCALNNSLPKDHIPTIPVYTPIYTSVNTPSPQTFANVLFDESYLKDCKTKYPPVYNQQIEFRGIYPGKTTAVELVNKFGQSYKYTKTEEGSEYFYSDPNTTDAYSFLIINNLVDSITVVADTGILSPLQEILNKYGCPDLIIAEALSNDTFNSSLFYNATSFVYLNSGLLIKFHRYPINYSTVPFAVGFVKPISVKDYFESKSSLLKSKILIPASFSEAIVDR